MSLLRWFVISTLWLTAASVIAYFPAHQAQEQMVRDHVPQVDIVPQTILIWLMAMVIAMTISGLAVFLFWFFRSMYVQRARNKP